MENILLRIESRLDDLTKAFHQLKTENQILRKEILGVSSSSSSDGMGLMESRTLREIVERTEFFVNRINLNMLENEREKEIQKNSKPRGKMKIMVSEESDSESFDESAEQFYVVEIRSKTLSDEREFLKETFKNLIKGKKVKDGESFKGTSVQKISNSIPFSKFVGTSCTMKLSNHLDSALTDLQCHFWWSSRNNGPTRVVGNFSEVFTFSGSPFGCRVLCSFAISQVLRLTIYCGNSSDGILFGIGFTPADVPTNDTMCNILHCMPPAPDVWMMTNTGSTIPLELFVNHGNLLVRGHMTIGPRSILHIEIMELLKISWPISVVRGKKFITDGKSFEMNQLTNKDGSISRAIEKSGRFSCNIEITNCLNVTLINGTKWYSNVKDFQPLEIPSFHRECFLGSSDTNFKAMFSYEIVSTDLALVIALKVGPGTNTFAAAFSQIPVVTQKKHLESFMNPSQWKIHNNKKCSIASKTLEVISDRNIRAEILMTEDEKSILKIRIFAV